MNYAAVCKPLIMTLIAAGIITSVASATCPERPGKLNFSVVGGSVVYYTLNTLGIPMGTDKIAPSTTITNAINAWNTGNAGSGASGTTFVLAGPGVKPDLIIQAVTTPRQDGVEAQTRPVRSGIVSVANQVTVTLYPSSTFSTSDPRLVVDPSQNNYSNALAHVIAHELAHVQGACDYNGQAGCAFVPEPWPAPSVLNLIHGVNDGLTIPPVIAPTSCDVALVASTSHFIASSSGGGGSGGRPIYAPPDGGGGGSSGVSLCGGGQYWDADNNTVYGWC